MGRSYGFSADGRLTRIDAALTGATPEKVVIAEAGASTLAENPNKPQAAQTITVAPTITPSM